VVSPSALTHFPTLQAPVDWKSVEFISDLHLHPSERATFQAWQHYLQTTLADAVFILGDLFEVWVGDDAAANSTSFELECVTVIARASQLRPVFFMHGNRDFLLGKRFSQLTQARFLDDPTVLCFGGARYLLSHGDALCLSDTNYQRFRAEVRSAQWQQQFLARPLAERNRIAREIRTHSETCKKTNANQLAAHDLDTAAVNDWLTAAQASTLIHGHTHQPATHDMGNARIRVVLSDWDLTANPPRAQVLRLTKHLETGELVLTRY